MMAFFQLVHVPVSLTFTCRSPKHSPWLLSLRPFHIALPFACAISFLTYTQPSMSRAHTYLFTLSVSAAAWLITALSSIRFSHFHCKPPLVTVSSQDDLPCQGFSDFIFHHTLALHFWLTCSFLSTLFSPTST